MDSITSGVSNPGQAYTYAKASLHFDFLGISEHNHATAGMLLPYYHMGMTQADTANEDGSFVTLFGMEWGTISTGGHVLVYGSNELLGWEPGNYDEFVEKGDYPALWRAINARPGAFGMLCHPENTDFNNLRNDTFNLVADSAVVGSVFRSGPAFSTNNTYSNQSSSSDEAYWRALLARGYHVGITYEHDNHNTTFGRTTEGRLVAIAPSLTKANLMKAFRDRNFYASDDWNTEVSFTINNQHIIGSIVQEPIAPTINVTYNDGDGEVQGTMYLMKGVPGSGALSTVLTTAAPGLSAFTYTDNTLQFGDSAYYYITITQADGDRIITSPIWYTRGNLISATEALEGEKESFLIWPNPVSLTAGQVNIGTPESGEISVIDALGRLISIVPARKSGTLLSLQGMVPGMYFISYSNQGGRRIIRKLTVL